MRECLGVVQKPRPLGIHVEFAATVRAVRAKQRANDAVHGHGIRVLEVHVGEVAEFVGARQGTAQVFQLSVYLVERDDVLRRIGALVAVSRRCQAQSFVQNRRRHKVCKRMAQFGFAILLLTPGAVFVPELFAAHLFHEAQEHGNGAVAKHGMA